MPVRWPGRARSHRPVDLELCSPSPVFSGRILFLKRAYTDMHTLPEHCVCTMKAPRPQRTFLAHSGPHREALGWQYEVLPLFLLCFLFFKI